MDNQNLLTGAVMLETMWKTRKKDLLDLISPFVIYASSKVCAPGEIVDQHKTLEFVKTEFGYIDMPIAIIQRVMKRSKSFERVKNQYRLTGNLDNDIAEIEKRRCECERKIRKIGEQLADYLKTHAIKYKKIKLDGAIQLLQDFFTRNGLFLGADRLEEHTDEIKNYEADYYIAQYLFEKKDEGAIEYSYAIDLVKGYFLQSAIYLQVGNGNIISSTYKNVSFYYDTPFLLRLLGYKTDEENTNALELHKALKKQNAKTFYFPQTQCEIERILFAYKKSNGTHSPQTLEGLDAKRYTPSDVDRIRRTWESKLNSVFYTNLAPRPEYQKDARGNIDVNRVLDEKELEETLKTNIRWANRDAMDADLESVLGIHKLRGTIQSNDIEHCKAVFVTTNGRLSTVVNRFYREKVNNQTFPLLITDSELAALTWIKCGSTGNLPERQLLRNAYIASQPTPELLEKFVSTLDQMQEEGKITTEMAVAMRGSNFVKKELLKESFENNIDQNTITKIERKLQEEYSLEARENERQMEKERRSKERHDRLENADQKARKVALSIKEKSLSRNRKIISVTSVCATILGLIGLAVSLVGTIPRRPFLIIGLIVFVMLSGVSTFDTVKGKERTIDQYLVRRANRKYDKVYQEKREEYISIADGKDENFHK